MKCVECGTEDGSHWGVSSQNQWQCSGCAMVERGIRINLLESALREFCDRVDRGEIRSVRTYNKFKQLLEEKA